MEGKHIGWVDSYRYLGVTIVAERNYVREYEEELRAKALSRRAFLGSKALWAFSRYEVTRELWKSVVVPALTFGNAVLLSRSAREAGRMTLGVHGFTPNEAVQGDLGRSTFEGREAVAKLTYERRLSGLPDGRWAREAYKYVHHKSMRTRWVARTRWLAERYRVEAVRLAEPLRRDTRQKVREVFRGVETEKWRAESKAKSALAVYSEGKAIIVKEGIYDNSKGSGLLCEARSGVLRTRSLRAKFTAELDTTCPLCHCVEETIRHVALECAALLPAVPCGRKVRRTAAGSSCDEDALSIALGFRDAGEAPNWDAVDATKQRLENWWKRQARQAPRRPPQPDAT
ncbi:hypothetical protein HPB50_020325 [Hyalomma asiaticum]|uniref:Uncharacterized protein n=1 Tax=Hyalomma asiaticum TaxID=266040 RepID=A0ACB7TN99_HYAAI|nr:hypothetical protein HPB50_020325 [Hyalomma asiaticum]